MGQRGLILTAVMASPFLLVGAMVTVASGVPAAWVVAVPAFFVFAVGGYDLNRRSLRPPGAATLEYDDRLGTGPLADLARTALRNHGELIRRNLPGTPDRFTLAILPDPPFFKRGWPSRHRRRYWAVTYHIGNPWALYYATRNRLPLQPCVFLIGDTWEQRLSGTGSPRAAPDRKMAVTLYHECCHVFGYGHGKAHRRLVMRFEESLAEQTSGREHTPNGRAPCRNHP